MTVRFLAISPSCIESTNRAIYRYMAVHYQIELHLVMPSQRYVGVEIKACAPFDTEPFTASTLKPSGLHVRLEKLIGLPQLIRKWQPTHILVEADPATWLIRQVTGAAQQINAEVWALTVENFQRDYLREGYAALGRGQLNVAGGGIIAWWLLSSARHTVDRCSRSAMMARMSWHNWALLGASLRFQSVSNSTLFFPQTIEQRTATRQRLGLNTTTIAYFGQLLPEKGVDLLLHALSQLRDFQWQFLIDRFSTYRTPYIEQLEQQIQLLDLSERIVYFDATHSEMPDYMNAADIVVLPSISTAKFKEQYGRVVPEAMACGRLVIGSESGAIPELIDGGGYTFPEGDVDTLTERLRYLFTASDDELTAMRTRAAVHAREWLSVERQAALWVDLLNQPPSARKR